MSCYRYPIPVSKANIASIAKFVLSHEVGHILDPDVYASKEEYANILTNIVEKLIEYDIDIEKLTFIKNLPSDLEECVVLLKNLIYRESKAWDIAKTLLYSIMTKIDTYLNELENMHLPLIISET